jgi:hypothetical protein
MEWTFSLAWEWFQWIAIRLALFLALLTLGPSLALIVFDLILYALRTVYDKMLMVASQGKSVELVTDTDDSEMEEVR